MLQNSVFLNETIYEELSVVAKLFPKGKKGCVFL